MRVHIRRAVVFYFMAILALAVLPFASAEDQDAVHIISGVVKHVHKGARTVVVKTADGTEQTFKWTGKTSWEGSKEAGKGLKEGSEVSVKYTEKAGEKTAVTVEDAGKDVGKGVKKAVE